MIQLNHRTEVAIGDEFKILDINDVFVWAKVVQVNVCFYEQEKSYIQFVFDKRNYYNKSFTLNENEMRQNNFDLDKLEKL